MGDVESGGPAPEKRVGDSERRVVDTRLQRAHGDGVLTLSEYDERSRQCWAARTRRELDALVADLPDPVPDAPPVPRVATAPPVPTGAVARADRSRPVRRRHGVVGLVLAGAALFGGVRVATADAAAVFGHQVVQVAPGQDRVDVGVLFGSVDVVVPDDARVDTHGLVVFGSTTCRAACDGTGARAVSVDGRGAFGSVHVVRQGERAAEQQRDRDDDD